MAYQNDLKEFQDDVPMELMVELQRAFTVFDRDGSGEITGDELGEVMKSLGHYPDEAELADMVKRIDSSGDGLIDFPEFLRMMMKQMNGADDIADDPQDPEEPQAEYTEEELRTAFKAFDRDGKGFIDIEGLALVMELMGEEMEDGELEQMMTDADTEGNGFISYEEFIAAMGI